mmetsp:Transcript_5074/g.16369  ORF Transcript_5074/g.16369 Transcript_5074/m.16369 type:complete len:266 (+) Transcript_5074:364-1161(+)
MEAHAKWTDASDTPDTVGQPRAGRDSGPEKRRATPRKRRLVCTAAVAPPRRRAAADAEADGSRDQERHEMEARWPRAHESAEPPPRGRAGDGACWSAWGGGTSSPVATSLLGSTLSSCDGDGDGDGGACCCCWVGFGAPRSRWTMSHATRVRKSDVSGRVSAARLGRRSGRVKVDARVDDWLSGSTEDGNELPMGARTAVVMVVATITKNDWRRTRRSDSAWLMLKDAVDFMPNTMARNEGPSDNILERVVDTVIAQSTRGYAQG